MKRVEFSEDGTLLLGVTEMRMGHLGTVVVFPVELDPTATQASEPLYTMTMREAKATMAAWSYLNKFVIVGHDDGKVSQYDGKVVPFGPGIYLEGYAKHLIRPVNFYKTSKPTSQISQSPT